jgi:hypothetical protein
MRCPYGNEGRSTSASEPVLECGSSTPMPVTAVSRPLCEMGLVDRLPDALVA